jgi:hypothetical protein
MTRIFTLLITGLMLAQEPSGSLTVSYNDFKIGDSKEAVIGIITGKKYVNYNIYYENNDRFLGGIKIKSENSIKLSAIRYMEKEDIILVFNNKDILFDIYSRIRPADIRFYSELKSYYTHLYGNPASEKIDEQTILSWSLNKKRHAAHLIYDNGDKSIILNFRDLNLDAKYIPK